MPAVDAGDPVSLIPSWPVQAPGWSHTDLGCGAGAVVLCVVLLVCEHEPHAALAQGSGHADSPALLAWLPGAD